MNRRIVSFFTIALLSLRVLAADTNATLDTAPAEATDPVSRAVVGDINDIITRINAKLEKDKSSEADMADNLKEFDALLVKYKDAPQTARAQILLAKAQLYMQVLEAPDKALDIFKQIKKDYPTVQVNGNIDDVIASLESAAANKKIRDSLAPGMAFPDFNETDLNGKPLSVSNYKGKVVLVDFWATWCPPCVAELPAIQKAYDKFHNKGFEVVGISLDEEKDRLAQFIKQKKMPWPQFFDGKRWDNKLAVKYGVDSTPTTYLLGRDGKIIARLDDADGIDSAVEKALKN